METQNNTDTGFKVNRLLLLECLFNRIPNVTFNDPSIKQNIDISVNAQVDNDKVFVTVSLKFEQIKDETTEVSCVITMLAEFEKIGEILLDLENFGKVNGAAIIYPYIREQLSNISLKAGLGNIILPPANFVKLNSTTNK
jgi:preprotein translocase subunit SecB